MFFINGALTTDEEFKAWASDRSKSMNGVGFDAIFNPSVDKSELLKLCLPAIDVEVVNWRLTCTYRGKEPDIFAKQEAWNAVSEDIEVDGKNYSAIFYFRGPSKICPRTKVLPKLPCFVKSRSTLNFKNIS